MARSPKRKSTCNPVSGIFKTPGVCGGEACVGTTRIPVWALEQGRRLGVDDDTLLKNYPSLGADNLAHAWAYVDQHRSEIYRDIRENEADAPEDG